MPSNIQENLPVAFAMLEKVPDNLRCGAHSLLFTDYSVDKTEGCCYR